MPKRFDNFILNTRSNRLLFFNLMFEITPDDIALLNDGDLRTLVARLAEAEMRNQGLSASTVTYGGHQNAADGGIDVRVTLPLEITVKGFVPCSATGFQVKAEDMPPAKITAEMCPSGSLRSAIQDLANQSGAYIIVSSKSSVSDSALQSRIDAMVTAVGKDNAERLKLDFYDRTRLATWVRDHTGMILWVREKLGRSIRGWKSYGAWAYDPKGVDGEYLVDDGLIVHTNTQQIGDGCSVLEAIKLLRNLLSGPRCVVRLVGLSGVGKTRFVQALFDKRVGEFSLEPARALYTNMSEDPEPQPTSAASDLISSRQRTILVIDNCGPELHRRLAEICRAEESTVSLITIEYDIQDDEPEGTEVFKLLPASEDLIEKLILKRFPHVLGINARTIANFSGGNARVAIALAETVGRRETLGTLSDTDLFHRLFRQRQPHEDSLFRVAQACSLVYSFQGEDISSDQSELIKLAAIVNKTSQEIYTGVSELRRRGLVQQRSVWRAVLPHAVANRLAATGLEDIPFQLIEAQLVYGGSERLAKSFSRRLGYLHGSKEAKRIVRRWLNPDGLLEDVVRLNELGKSMLLNIAAADPEAALSALERAWKSADQDQRLQLSRNYLRLVRSVAYDAALFERCVTLILQATQPEESTNKRDEATEALTSLFFIHFSGTHATIEQRLQVIERMLFSNEAKQRGLGVKALNAALRTSHFDSWHYLEFGAHSRDYGYWPSNVDEVKHWFRTVLKLVEDTIGRDDGTASIVRNELAKEFYGLWDRAEMFDELENLSRLISAKKFWPEGWVAAKRLLQLGSGKETVRLSQLESLLRPTNLVQRVKSVVLSTGIKHFDVDYFEDGSAQDLQQKIERTEELARSLGKAVALDETTLEELLPELVTGEGRLWSFGRGLAEGSDKPEVIWNKLANQLSGEGSRVEIFCGLINALHAINSNLANALLDKSAEDERLLSWYPRLEASIPVNKEGVSRLMRSLMLKKTPIAAYRSLAWGGAIASVSGEDLIRLITEISARPSGFDVALEIIAMRIHFYPDKTQCPEEVISAGRELLRHIEFSKELDNHDYNLAAVVQTA